MDCNRSTVTPSSHHSIVTDRLLHLRLITLFYLLISTTSSTSSSSTFTQVPGYLYMSYSFHHFTFYMHLYTCINRFYSFLSVLFIPFISFSSLMHKTSLPFHFCFFCSSLFFYHLFIPIHLIVTHQASSCLSHSSSSLLIHTTRTSHCNLDNSSNRLLTIGFDLTTDLLALPQHLHPHRHSYHRHSHFTTTSSSLLIRFITS